MKIINLIKNIYFGYLGVILITSGFFILSLGRLEADELIFFVLSFVGGVVIAVRSFALRDYPIVLLQIVLILISTFGILRVVS